jgi:hypothetical protein
MCGVHNNPPPRPTPPPAAPPPAAPPPAAPPQAAAPPAAPPPLAQDAPTALAANPAVDVKKLERAMVEALAGVAMLMAGAKMLQGGQSAPSCCGGCIPAPQTQPQGGLQVGAVDGFPANSIRTAGGYTIVPEGKDAAWKIYSPGQQACEEPTTRVWGDPHVNEKDGTRWDFTKDSNFTLPDGTLIRCDTTAETGHSLTQGLTIVSGNDRVQVNGVNTGNPQVTASKDASEWFSQNAETLAQGNTFALQHDGKDVSWFRSTNGKLDGLVTGSRDNVDGKGSYDQVIDGKIAPKDPFTAQNSAADNNANVDVRQALALFGLMALGGTGFLGGNVDRFFGRVQDALSSLFTQGNLDDAFQQNLARFAVRA